MMHSPADHDHGHGHDHDHGHHHHGIGGHSHAPASFGRAFAIGITLNLAFVIIEGGYGIAAGSVALLADAGHNLSDVLGLGMAWTATALATRRPSERFTYGLKGSSILAALGNAVLLLVACGMIAWEAIQRLGEAHPVASGTVMIVAAIGIAVNLGTALLFARGQDDLNIRGAFVHMAGDAAISAGVVLAGLAIRLTGKAWIDPATSLVIVGFIVWSSWGLLRDAIGLSLGAVPPSIDLGRVRGHLQALPGVSAVHDLHVWAMGTSDTALTAHLVLPDGHPGDDFLSRIAHDMEHRFGIGHTTLQIELDADCACATGCDSAG